MAGRRIDDHSSFAGSAPKGCVFPEGNKIKGYSSSEGAGDLSMYEDTSEEIKTCQDMGKSKAKAYPQKPYYRN